MTFIWIGLTTIAILLIICGNTLIKKGKHDLGSLLIVIGSFQLFAEFITFIS